MRAVEQRRTPLDIIKRQHLQKFVPFLHNKFQNTDCYKCIANIARDAYLSEQDAAELLKAETHPQQANLNDEIIRKLNQDNKITTLPEKAFETTMRYVGQKMQMTDEQTNNLLIPMARMADTYSNEHHKLAKKVFYSMPNKDNVQYLPVKQREAVQKCQQELSASNMSQYFKTLQSNDESTVDKMVRYDDLLKKITDGHTPDATEIKEFYDLHLAVSGDTIPASMHNRPQAYLENYQTQQEIRQQLPSKPNIEELLKKAKAQENLTVMELVYLQFYLNKHIKKLDTGTKEAIFKAFQNYPDLYQAAREQVELIDSDMLEILKRLVGKIEREQYRFTAEAEAVIFETEEYGKHIIETTTQGEPRFKNEAQDKTKLAVIKLLENGAYVDDGFLKTLTIHWPTDIVQLPKDYHGNDANDGSVYYVPDQQMGSDINAYIARVTQNAKNEYRLYIIETNPAVGIMLSIYDHLISLDESLKGLREYPNYPLHGNTKIGSHRKNNGSNEHGHLGKLFMPYESQDAQAVFAETDTTAMRAKIRGHIEDFNNNKKLSIDKMQSPTFKVIETWRNHPSDDITIISLFTPGTQLYNQYFREVDQIMREDTEALQMNLIAPTLYAFTRGRDISGDKKQTVDDYLKGLNEAEKMWKILNLPSISNQQQLEALITILTRVKLLLAQVGETNSRLDVLIQQTHDANIKLREKIFQSNSKLEQTLQHINNQLQ